MKKMTTIKNLLIIAVAATGMIFTSCKKEKEATTPANKDAELMEIPCQSEGSSDKDFFRADASATSQDMNLSREKALTNTKQRVASLIETKIKSVTDRYVNETEFNQNSQFEQKFENMTREVVKQTLRDVSITCEKTYKEANGKFTTYLALEVNKKELLEGIDNQLTKDQKLQVDYDKQKFEEIFNEEMENLEEEGVY